MGRLAGKYALITGGTSGIGLATAQTFIAEGAQVAVTGRNPVALEQAQALLGNNGWVIAADSGDAAGQRQLAATLADRWPQLDVVFVNAGDVTHAPFGDWREAEWDRLMNINLKGPFFLLQALLPHGIRVNGLSPGPVRTPALDKLGLSAQALSDLQEEIKNLVPLGRMGTPQELANAALYLASDESSYVLGSELRVDGGTGNL